MAGTLAALGLAVLGACGTTKSSGGSAGQAAPSGDGSTSSPQQPRQAVSATKACDVLVKADVEASLGITVKAPTSASGPGDCTYISTDNNSGASITIASWDAIKAAATSPGEPPTAVDGIGDEALTVGRGRLYVRKGAQGFLLHFNSPTADNADDQGLTIGKNLAAKVLARM